jgi:hypothetical protein
VHEQSAWGCSDDMFNHVTKHKHQENTSAHDFIILKRIRKILKWTQKILIRAQKLYTLHMGKESSGDDGFMATRYQSKKLANN